MTSRTLLNLSLTVSLAVLIAIVIIEPGKEKIAVATNLTQLKSTEIKHILVQSPELADIELKKIENHWQMLAPFSTPANQERVAQLLKIVATKNVATYAIDDTNLQQLQLAAPSLTLTLNNTRLDFGGTSPLGGSRYIRINNTVHLITDRYSHLVRGPATNLISPTLIHASAQITALQLPSLNLILVDGHWQFKNNPAQQQIEPDHLQKLLDEWHHARALNVQPLDSTLRTSVNKNAQTITITTLHSSKRFTLINTDNEFILQRADLGLQYHFSQETGRRLLTLPTINDA